MVLKKAAYGGSGKSEPSGMSESSGMCGTAAYGGNKIARPIDIDPPFVPNMEFSPTLYATGTTHNPTASDKKIAQRKPQYDLPDTAEEKKTKNKINHNIIDL